jgi:hypothetical protein
MIISENNWMIDNFTSTGLTSDYDITFNLYSFKPLNFYLASEQAAIKLSEKYKNLYVGLSGGIDSEYVLFCFHKLKIPIIPLIILCEGNEEETKYAFKICKKLNIIPKVITCSNYEILDICVNFIYKKMNGVGFESATRAHAMHYVKNNGGTLICGDSIIGDGNRLIRDSEYTMDEWAGYFGYEIGFFTYTPELTYSMISGNTLDGENMSWKEYKSKLFGLEMRDKMSYIYPKNNQKIIESMYRVDPIEQKRLNHLRSLGIPVPREPPPLSTNNNFKTGIKWKKNEILDIFKPYLI